MEIYKKYLTRTLQGGGRPTVTPALRKAFEQSKSMKSEPLHERSIYRESYEESPNYRATNAQAKDIQEKIKKGEIEAVKQADGTYKYVATGKTIPDDTHEMIMLGGVGVGKGLAQKVISSKPFAKGVEKAGQAVLGFGEGLSKHYMPRDAASAVGYYTQAGQKAYEGDYKGAAGDAIMGNLRFAQSAIPASGSKIVDYTVGAKNPIYQLVLGTTKIPKVGHYVGNYGIPVVNSMLRSTGVAAQMIEPGKQGQRLDRPKSDPKVLEEKSESRKKGGATDIYNRYLAKGGNIN